MFEGDSTLDHVTQTNRPRALSTLLHGCVYACTLVLATGCEEPKRASVPVSVVFKPEEQKVPTLEGVAPGTNLFNQTFVVDEQGTQAAIHRKLEGITVEINGQCFRIVSVYAMKMEFSGNVVGALSMMATATRAQNTEEILEGNKVEKDPGIDVSMTMPESGEKEKTEVKQQVPLDRIKHFTHALSDAARASGSPHFTFKVPGENILLTIETDPPQPLQIAQQ